MQDVSSNVTPADMDAYATVEGAASFVDILQTRVRELGDRDSFIFLSETSPAEVKMTYAELDVRARQIGALLQRLGAVGERVLILLNTSREYVEAFYGCMYAGAIGVPAFPPMPASRIGDRLVGIVEDSGAKFALVDTAMMNAKEEILKTTPSLSSVRWIAVDQVASGTESFWEPPRLSRESLCFLQYTSGSTGNPRGVMISHGNMISNTKIIYGAMGIKPQDRSLFWLPIYHDMGLISGVVLPVIGAFQSVLCPPTWFIRKPERWVETISKYRIALSGAPNFAFELCSRRVAGGAPVPEGFDLSSWRIAFNGAEPIRADTLRRFAKTFEKYNFRAEQLHPCYGMAEATLMVSAGRVGLPPETRLLDRDALAANRVVFTTKDRPHVEVVASGAPRPEIDIRTVNIETKTEAGPDEIGEIWLAGPTMSKGYWNRPEENVEKFGAKLPNSDTQYFRTGDTGFIRDGLHFIVGRIKEVLIIRGKNHHPYDIERTVEAAHPGLKGCVSAAFSIDADNEEKLVIVLEVPKEDVRAADVLEPIRRAIVEVHDLKLHALTLINRGSLPRTSSGKIMRLKTRSLFSTGELQAIDAWTNPSPSGVNG